MNLTQLKPTDLYVLPVEKDATEFGFVQGNPIINFSYQYGKGEYVKPMLLPEGKWKYIGTITRDGVFDFDAKLHARDETAFIAFLEHNNIYLTNPMGENEPEYIAGIKNGIAFHNNEVVNQWQSYQDKVVPDGMKLIVIEKTK